MHLLHASGGTLLSPKEHLMSADEIEQLASLFVSLGISKIRLTGGEPLVRKDFSTILEKLARLPVELAITSNAVSIDRHFDELEEAGVKKVNISLDSLSKQKFEDITRRNYFDRVMENINLLCERNFDVKLNSVLLRGFNEDEVLAFVNLTRELPTSVRFIEFMPFDGNQWKANKLISLEDVLNTVEVIHGPKLQRISDAPNDTSKNYKIKGFQGDFGVISTVTSPFCDTCNRLRLTANGHLKNCLFSNSETDLLTPLRQGMDIRPLIHSTVHAKKSMRGGMDTPEKLSNPDLHSQNRSMIMIGG